MDNIKLFAENERELETPIHRVMIYSEERRMVFGIEECTMQGMKSGKRHMMEGIELPNKKRIKTLGERESINT